MGKKVVRWEYLADLIAALTAKNSVAATDHDVATADHGIASADHGTSTADHGVSTADHGIASTDHGIATADHGISAADHIISAADHVTSGADHGVASADHGVASADHGISTTDHGVYAADHIISAADHVTSAADHVTYAADHVISTADHGVASTDHGIATADHGIATADHGIAVGDHTDTLAAVAAIAPALSNSKLSSIQVTIDGRGGVPAINTHAFAGMPAAGTLTYWRLIEVNGVVSNATFDVKLAGGASLIGAGNAPALVASADSGRIAIAGWATTHLAIHTLIDNVITAVTGGTLFLLIIEYTRD